MASGAEISTRVPAPWIAHPGIGLFLASFLSLFLELLMIRWVPSHVRVIAYYSNLMLISSFLGLGSGILLARRELRLDRWFGFSFLLLILFVSMMKGTPFEQGPDELRFLFKASTRSTVFPVAFIFIFNAALFVPLGDLMGGYFKQIPPLRAYSWDLAGAVSGCLLFGLFSYVWFSPIFGCMIVMLVYLVYCRSRLHLLTAVGTFTVGLAMMALWTDRDGIWSPYNLLGVRELDRDGSQKLAPFPPSDLATVRDPPFYVVGVNLSGYMLVGTIDGRRYSAPGQYRIDAAAPMSLADYTGLYTLPHRIRPGARDALVVGSGGGIDLEAALLAGLEHIDAVEIDPVIVHIGRTYNASRSYTDPRVSVHNTDARAFFRQAGRAYDMVVFGFLDSQSLFNQMSNIRLDGYVHTRESYHEAFGLLRQGGLLSVSFYAAGQLWLLDRLVSMVRSATGTAPVIYVSPMRQVVIFAGKGFDLQGPNQFGVYRRIEWKPSGAPEATDDWPYLYLRRRFIPSDYFINIGLLLAISVVFVLVSTQRKRTGVDLHFFFLGAGFLLLETKSMTTIALYFGATWLVSTIVILGVLLMVLLANLVASRIGCSSSTLYLPLIASIALLYFFPNQNVLAWPFALRLLYSLTAIPLPIFFAGLIFSSTFRDCKDPGFSFGSNLLGAMVGGFVEYLGMITGMKALLLVVLAFYLASLLVRPSASRLQPAGA